MSSVFSGIFGGIFGAWQPHARSGSPSAASTPPPAPLRSDYAQPPPPLLSHHPATDTSLPRPRPDPPAGTTAHRPPAAPALLASDDAHRTSDRVPAASDNPDNPVPPDVPGPVAAPPADDCTPRSARPATADRSSRKSPRLSAALPAAFAAPHAASDARRIGSGPAPPPLHSPYSHISPAYHLPAYHYLSSKICDILYHNICE